MSKVECENLIRRILIFRYESLSHVSDKDIYKQCISFKDMADMTRGLVLCLQNDPNCKEELEKFNSINSKEQEEYLINEIIEEFIDIFNEAQID